VAQGCIGQQDVLCRQFYFSTLLPTVLQSLPILPNLIVKGSLNEKLPSYGISKLKENSRVKKRIAEKKKIG